MTCQKNDNVLSEITEVLFKDGMSGLDKAVSIIINEAMRIERSKHLNADPYERSNQRNDYANGFKDKTLKTRIGEIELKVPQVRNCNFYPSFLEKGLRSERALIAAIAEMYVIGVSTRRVQNIIEKMCGFDVSSSDVSRASKSLDEELDKWRNRTLGSYRYLFLDARYEKVRYDNSVIDCAIFIAIGIDENGKKDVLGISAKLSEQEPHWREFLQSLQTRGLRGVELIISDAHTGLKAAKKAVFPSVKWQRCQFHLQQNAQSYIPKKDMKKQVAFDIRSIFNAPSQHEADRLLSIVSQKYAKDAPALSEWMMNNIPEGFTVFNFPVDHWIKIRTNNATERLNREIKRRTHVASIFPNVASCERLVSAVLIEVSEEWQTGGAYLNFS
ncbi:MAG: IS256 family transposase [Candidatus Paceibacterota bacterium]|jgi:transposase-like protein